MCIRDRIGPVSAQSCFSAGTTLGDYLTATNKGTPGAQCSVNNKVQTAHGISYDTTCTSQSMASKGHIDFQLPDAEHFSGTSHTTVTGTTQGRPINTAIDKTFAAKFLASDCGSVKPLVVPSQKSVSYTHLDVYKRQIFAALRLILISLLVKVR